MIMTEEERIKAGVLFWPQDAEFKKLKKKAHDLSLDYNETHEDEEEKRMGILSSLLGRPWENGFIQGPVHFHYGVHTKIGKNFFANFNLTIQDDACVTIGDDCCFGPNITIVTPLHPMIRSERKALKTKDGEKKTLCYAKPVTIGNGCWFGASVTVCPGVKIGDGCVIGAGSVVTRDIPSGTFAAGVPCRVIREISEKDSMKYKPNILSDNEII